MNKQNKSRRIDRSRRLIAAFFLIILAFMTIRMEDWDPVKLNIIPEETINPIDWKQMLSDLEYSINGKKPVSDTEDKQLSLYAKSAVLLDADSGRVLYGKNEDTELPMASTTKIMTCILALEYGNTEDVMTVSSYAASQPEVKLGIRAGETYVLKDMLYAMMLTSYNDCAVAIAEHIGGSVEGFADMMNEKAADLGCHSTWFITANGLDAENEGGAHRTTASDLAGILAYAIRNETFLEITQTSSHSFADCSGKRRFTAVNKNSFFTMMDGVLSGKTGYTTDAGYCYAGALSQEGKKLIAVVLGSGWPPHKTRKWSDTKTLMNYGLNNYSSVTVGDESRLTEVEIPVKNGIRAVAIVRLDWSERTILMKEGEEITAKIQIPEQLSAPLTKGAVVGHLSLGLNHEPILLIPVVLMEPVKEFSFFYCFEHIFAYYFDISSKM